MNIIKINCPNCDELIEIVLNEDFTIQSLKLNEVKISEQEQIETLKKHGIMFG